MNKSAMPSTPLGLAVQQDLALDVGHLDRNGHFFDGDGTTSLDPQDCEARMAAFPRLYRTDRRRLMLRITGGAINLADLHVGPAGYAG